MRKTKSYARFLAATAQETFKKPISSFLDKFSINRKIGGKKEINLRYKCFTLSPRRPYEEYKRMVLEHTHGLFIT